MKAKTYSLLVILTFFTLCTFVIKIHYESKSNNFVFNEISIFSNKLNKKLVDNYFSDDTSIKGFSDKEIKKVLLKDLGYQNWFDYLEFIEINLYPVDVINDNVEDLVIAVNLSKDLGVIGIYRLYEDSYILSNKIDDLCRIENVSAVRIESTNKTFLIIEEVLDEMVGAYFIDNYIRIFSEINNHFVEVYRQSVDYSTYFLEKWSNPEADGSKWYKIVEKGVVDNITVEETYITINISKSLSKFEDTNSSHNSVPNDFKLVEQKNFDMKLIWNENYDSFIMAEGKIISQNIDVGILEDTTQTVDFLLNLTDKYYKVIDKNKKIKYVDKNDILVIRYFSNLEN